MSRDIETLLRGVTPPSLANAGLVPASDLRRRADRRRWVARCSSTAAVVAVLVLVGAGVRASWPVPTIVPAPPAATETVMPLPAFPVPVTLHNGDPAVARTQGTGADDLAANMAGKTTTYFTCVGGGVYSIFYSDVSNNPTVAVGGSSGECEGRVDSSTVTLPSGASRAIVNIAVDPGVQWAIQVVPATE